MMALKCCTFSVSTIVLLALLLAPAPAQAQSPYSEDFMEFFRWMENDVMRTTADNVDIYELSRVMGYMLRKQMEKHNVYEPSRQTDADRAALQKLNSIHNEYSMYARQCAETLNRFDPSFDIMHYERVVWQYFETTFRGGDVTYGSQYDIDGYIEQMWGINPGAIPQFVRPSGGGGGEVDERGYDRLLGRWTRAESRNGGQTWVRAGMSLHDDLSPDGYGRRGEYLPGNAIWWQFQRISDGTFVNETIVFRDASGNIVGNFVGDGNIYSGNSQTFQSSIKVRDPDGVVRDVLIRLTKVQ
jgi:hypothetical protein